MTLDNQSTSEENDNQFDNLQDQYQFDEEPVNGGNNGGRNNRTFLLIAGLIGGVFVLLIIGLVVFVLLNRGRAVTQLQEEAARINAENTAIAQQATEIAVLEIQRLTEKAIIPPTWTPTVTAVIAEPTATPVVETPEVELSSAERTATVAAFLTQVAIGTPAPGTTPGAATPLPTPTALPDTGLIDDVGLPGMLGLAAVLVLLVFIVRRLRFSASG